MPLLALLLALSASCEEPAVRRVELASPEPRAVAEELSRLRESGVKGLPEGWSAGTDLAQDPFFSALSQSAAFQEGRRSLIVEDGEFRGILLTHDGRSFLYKPPEGFAVQAPQAGEEPRTALKLEGGRLVEKPIASLSAAERQAALAGAGRVRTFSLGGLDRGFDGGVGRGSAVFLGGKRVRSVEAGPGEFKAVPRPPGKELPILNEYKGTPPESLAAGQFFWDGKSLMVAEAAEQGGGTRARAVGYMADMKDDPKGSVVFWHGGAEPDAKGRHAAARENWALFYIPKVEKAYEVEGGRTTARYVSQYAMVDLKEARRFDTPEGPRLDLASALKPYPTRETLDGPPSERRLLRYGAPQGSRDHKFQAYVDMEGWLYQEKAVGAERRIVRVERLFNVKEPAPSPSPSDRLPEPPPLVAPAPLREEPPAPDPLGEFVAYSRRRDASPGGRLEAARVLLGALPGDEKAAQTAADVLGAVIGAAPPRHMLDAARRIDDEGVHPGLIAAYEKERRALEVSAANGKAPRGTPHPFPGGADPAAFEAIKLLAGLELESGAAIESRTAAFRAGLSHPDPLVRVAAADALARLGERGRSARRMLAAAALLDLNPDARSAAAMALLKVDPSAEESYRLLPQFPKPAAPPPKPVHGPQLPAPRQAGPPAGESDLVAALKLPRSDRDRRVAVNAAVGRLARAAMVDPRDPEVLSARRELAPLLESAEPLTRAEAAGTLLLLTREEPDARAALTLKRFLLSDARSLDPAMRAYAVSGLGYMGKPDPDTLGTLKTVVENTREDAVVRAQAFRTYLQLLPDDSARQEAFARWSRDARTKGLVPAPQPQASPFDPFTRPADPFSRLGR